MKYFFLLAFLLSIVSVNAQNDSIKDDGRTIKIPVIIHLVKKNKRYNVPVIIDKERIAFELNSLNENFSASNDMTSLSNYFIDKKLIGNAKIQFYLKDVVIHQRHKKGKRIEKIEPEKYLNIIVGKYRFTKTPCTLTNECTPSYVQINYTKFGKGSQTVTHEIGHWLGLYHVWGNKGKCKKAKNPSDFIPDTPTQLICTEVKRNNDCPPVDENEKPNYNNFMDYSSCRCFFTKGQVKVIRDKIIKYRRKLYDNSI